MTIGPPAAADREKYAEALRFLKSRSALNYAGLADKTGRPVSTIHGWITGKHLPYARDNADFSRVLQLLDAVDVDGWMNVLYQLRDGAEAGSHRANTTNPYLGLESFTEEDAAFFCGRNALTHQLVSLVENRLAAPRQENLVAALPPNPLVVTGASGAGKTSVLRAGLLAALRSSTGLHCPPGSGVPDLRYSTPSHDVRRIFAPADQTTACCRVIVIDQFEELLGPETSGTLSDVVSRIGRACAHAGTAVVIGMRADFFDRAIEVPILRNALQAGPVIVEAPTTEQATECIVGPARGTGLEVDTELTVRLIDEFSRHANAQGATEALPLLSHVLYELADSADDRRLTVQRYHDIGGLERALERSAERVYGELSLKGRDTCRRLFEQLVRLGENSLPTRRICRLADVLDASATHVDQRSGPSSWPELDQVIDAFVAKRLLTLDVDTITISHEALLAAWPRLAEWVEELRHQLSVLRRIAVMAGTWMELDRNPDALLMGTLLDDADGLIMTPGAPRLSEDELAFVDASRAAHAERRRRDEEVLSRQLAMQSTMLHDVDAPLAAQIAVIAHQQAPTVTTRSALIAATSPLPGARYLGDPGPTEVAVAGKAPVAAVTNAARGTVTVMRIDADDRARLSRTIELAVTSPNADAYAVALSPDGTMLAVGGTDRQLTLVDLSHPDLEALAADRVLTGNAVIPAPHLTHPAVTFLADERTHFTGAVHSLAFDGDGAALFAAGAANGVARWSIGRSDTAAPEGISARLDVVFGRKGTVHGVSVGPHLVATAHLDGSVALFAADTGTELWRDDGSSAVGVGAVCLSPTERVLLAGNRNGDIRAWRLDHDDGLIVTELDNTGPTFSSWVNRISVSPSGHYAVAASSDGRAVIRATQTGEQVGGDLIHPTVVTSAVFLDDSTLATTSEDGTLRTWRISDPPSDATIWANAIDATGRSLATASGDEVVVHHDDDANVLHAPGTLTLSGAAAMSEDGALLIAGTRQGVVLVSERSAQTETGEWSSWHELVGMHELIEYTAMSGDGRVLGAVDRNGVMQLWVRRPDGVIESAGGDEVHPPAVGLDISGDGSLVAVSSESGHVTLYDVGSAKTNPWQPKQVAAFATGESFALCVVFHPSQPILAIGNADRSVSLWSIELADEPSLIARLTGPGGHPMAITWDRSGQRLAAGTTDGVAWVWDVRDARAPIEFARITAGSPVYAMSLSPDGSRLYGAGPAGRTHTWILDESTAVAVLEQSAGDPITPGEWDTYVPTIPYPTL
ncbi:MAG: hypothetical protein AAGA42_07055 [Actinomycetota bacterium]